jgi:hypothetical protein
LTSADKALDIPDVDAVNNAFQSLSSAGQLLADAIYGSLGDSASQAFNDDFDEDEDDDFDDDDFDDDDFDDDDDDDDDFDMEIEDDDVDAHSGT